MEQTPQPVQPRSSNSFYLFVGLVIIAIILVVGLWSRKGNGLMNGSQPSGTEVQQPTQAPKTGSMSLMQQGGVVTAKVGVPFTVAVAINSMGRLVTGYDTLVQFDKTAFTAGTASSLLPGYQVDQDSQKVALAVTGFKSSTKTPAQTMSGAPVFTFTLTPKKAGVYTINLVDVFERSKSKFVDTATTVYYPSVNSLSVTVQ